MDEKCLQAMGWIGERTLPFLPSYCVEDRTNRATFALALLRYDPSERAAPAPELGRAGSYPLLDVVVVDLGTGEVADLGTRVASDVNPVSWTPDGQALLVNRYDDAP